MLYLYGDESGNPGSDTYFGLGYLISLTPQSIINKVRQIRKKYNYYREIKYTNNDYSQILTAIDLIDYFFKSESLFFKIIIKDKKFFDPHYYDKNSYNVKNIDLGYIDTYSTLTRSVRVEDYKETSKICLVDNKPLTGKGLIRDYILEKDEMEALLEMPS